MPARHRQNPKTQEIRFRVYYLPERLRKAMHQRRQKLGLTVGEFVQAAVSDELSRLVETLAASGIEPCDSDARPAKLPLNDRLLGDLKIASETTGISQSQLLLSCLRISTNRKRRPSIRKK